MKKNATKKHEILIKNCKYLKYARNEMIKKWQK